MLGNCFTSKSSCWPVIAAAFLLSISLSGGLGLEQGLPYAAAADFCSGDDSCGFGKVCADGKCVTAGDCAPRYEKRCVDYDVYWFDSCGIQGERFADCGLDEYLSEYQCSRNMVQQKIIARGCDKSQCLEVAGWIDLKNCDDTGNICKNGACRADVATPPIIYYLSPSGKVTGSAAALSLATNEIAECRYSYYDVSFDQMASKFNTSDGIRHSVSASLSAPGVYNFYVRCRNTAGSANLVSSKISFQYAPVAETRTVPDNPRAAADTAAPEISESSLSPSGQVDAATVQVALATNEKAVCRFDMVDTGYNSMKNGLAVDGSGTVHRRSVQVPAAGKYTFYVRCKDAAGNANKTSAKISFTYVAADQEVSPISNIRPFGTIYQKEIALEVSTKNPSSCFYSANESDLESAAELFTTNDGQQHIAIVSLGDYGNYQYYVRCQDNADQTKELFAPITFQFKDPGGGTAKTDECVKVAEGIRNNKCDAVLDCICDPDCSGTGAAADPDCVSVSQTTPAGPNWFVIGIVALLVSGIGIAIFISMRRKGDDQFDAEDDEVGL